MSENNEESWTKFVDKSPEEGRLIEARFWAYGRVTEAYAFYRNGKIYTSSSPRGKENLISWR